MKIAIMQPYLFPYIGYFQIINAVDIFVIYDDVNYIKGGWINRNKILSSGKEHMFTFPVSELSPNKRINECKLYTNDRNIRKFIDTIKQSYSKAPQYKVVFPIVNDIIKFEKRDLAVYTENSLRTILHFIDVRTKLIRSSDIDKDNSLRGQDKVLEICQKLKATVYINSIGGRELYSKEDFARNNVDLFFIKTKDITYKQFNIQFVPNLSIIDVLMFNTKEEVKSLLSEYDLV